MLVIRATVLKAEGVEDVTPLFRADRAAAPVGLPRKVYQKEGVRSGWSNRHNVGAAGREWVAAVLTRVGFKVAVNSGDGRDSVLMVSREGMQTRPVRVISSSGRMFLLKPRWDVAGGLLVYVWHAQDPSRTVAYVLTYAGAFDVAGAKGWTKTKSWLEDHYYYTTNPGDELMQLLRRYEVLPGRWAEAIDKHAL